MKRLLLLGDEAIAQAALDAGLFPSVAVIDDSTFTYSGMTGLLDAVVKNSSVTVN